MRTAPVAATTATQKDDHAGLSLDLGVSGLRRSHIAARIAYLNTGDTPLFHKGAQLFGAHLHQLSVGATAPIVEGPMDAIAVTSPARALHPGCTAWDIAG